MTQSSSFEEAIDYVLQYEGGLSVNPKDPGGITNYGISLRFLSNLPESNLRVYGIFEKPDANTIMNLTKEQAIKIYYGEFWNEAPFYQILDQGVCNYVFDMAVNHGIRTTIKLIQQASNKLAVDGILGEKTLAFINEFLPANMIIILKAIRIKYYKQIILNNPHMKIFIRGWMNRANQK